MSDEHAREPSEVTHAEYHHPARPRSLRHRTRVKQSFERSRLRHVMVSGSALPPAGYHWVMEHMRPDQRLDSTSGGTDISGSFVFYDVLEAQRRGCRPARVRCATRQVASPAW